MAMIEFGGGKITMFKQGNHILDLHVTKLQHTAKFID
jgi:hypothetical protein